MRAFAYNCQLHIRCRLQFLLATGLPADTTRGLCQWLADITPLACHKGWTALIVIVRQYVSGLPSSHSTSCRTDLVQTLLIVV